MLLRDPRQGPDLGLRVRRRTASRNGAGRGGGGWAEITVRVRLTQIEGGQQVRADVRKVQLF